MDIKTNIKSKQGREYRKILIVAVLVIIISTLIILSYKYYNNPSLIGKWKSLETGIVVEFTEEGIVKVNSVDTGDYTLNSSDLMVYVVEGHEFNMIYKIEGRNLIWGLEGQEERFERNGL
ncbi:MAG: hypothetical protein GX366_08825 [Epulopiscium sp.]|nr:hypothetical protein [Candidatus Epulonipiscium sp.]